MTRPLRSYALLLCLLCSVSVTGWAQHRSPKRGFCTNEMAYRENFEALATGCSWFYNWSYKAPNVLQNDFENINMDYVPMVWGWGQENYQADLIAYLEQHPNIRYILGYNEPNFSAQANMSPRQAAAKWHEIEEIADRFNLQIVGPAVNFAAQDATCCDTIDGKQVCYADPFDYYNAFFEACPDCRVDYLGLHLYMPAGAYKPYIDRLSAEHGNRQVWLTEFNYNGGGTADTTAHINFITSELESLEKNPNVFRYAWFMSYGMARHANLVAPGQGKLTTLGKVYTQLSAFDTTYYHQTDTRIEAEHFITQIGCMVRPSTDDSTLMIRDFESGKSASYLVEIPAAATYYFHPRWATKAGSEVRLYVDDVLVSTIKPAATGDFSTWGEEDFPITLTAGKHTFRIYSASRMFYLNWFRLNSQLSALPAVSATSSGTQKILYNGEVIILHNNKAYNLLGLPLSAVPASLPR